MATLTMDQLKKQKKRVKTLMTKYQHYVTDLKEPVDKEELQDRFTEHSRLFDEFLDIIRSMINLATEEEAEALVEEEDSCRVSDRKARLSVKKLLGVKGAPQAEDSGTSEASTSSRHAHTKVPIINLPQFTGKIEEWQHFRDLFELIIDTNKSLSNIEKFHHLITSVKGDAAFVIQKIAVSDDNYTVAWNSLKTHYQNKRAIICAHLNHMFNLPKVVADNAAYLRNHVHEFTRNLGCLQILKEPTVDSLLIHLSMSKMDSVSKGNWEEYCISLDDTLPTQDQLIKFLTNRYQILRAREPSPSLLSTSSSISSTEHQRESSKRQKSTSHVATSPTCAFCSDNHNTAKCDNYLKKSYNERWQVVRDKNLCFACLSKGGAHKDCRYKCFKCSRKHNATLHKPSSDFQQNLTTSKFSPLEGSPVLLPPSTTVSSADGASTSGVALHTDVNFKHKDALLQTVQIQVRDSAGQLHTARALLDNGSSLNLMSAKFAATVNTPIMSTNTTIFGVGNTPAKSQGKTTRSIYSMHCKYSTELEFVILEQLASMIPNNFISTSKLDIPAHLPLADPNFHVPGPIDMILGSGIFWHLTCVGQLQLESGIILQKTKLGWIVAGNVVDSAQQSQSFHVKASDADDKLHDQVNQDATGHGQWRHVQSDFKPADIISRGTTASELRHSNIWWPGPEFLLLPSSAWPAMQATSSTPDAVELRTIKQVLTVTYSTNLFECTRYSSWAKLQRVAAYCLRYVHNLRNQHRSIGPLTANELRAATLILLRQEQELAFATELSALRKGDLVPRTCRLLRLRPLLGAQGLLRVGGRLQHATIPYEQQHPIILPSKNQITELIISYEHVCTLHAVANSVLAAVRTNYWPLAGITTVTRILRQCVRCSRDHPTPIQPMMDNLPAARPRPARPISICGLDYCEPFHLLFHHRRGARTTRAYVAVFVCFTTKAIHLELVGDLTAASCLGAMQRMMPRRGLVTHMYSDNGTNFVGVNHELKQLAELFNAEANQHVLAASGVEWHFLPPRSPHMGGLWEAAVKSAKRHLRRVSADAHLTFEEMSTLLTQVEACLNSRPMTPLSDDPADFAALTPGHFLIGGPLNAPPDVNLTNTKVNRLSHWQHVQQVTQHFWQRWQQEYLGHQQQRAKWYKDAVPLRLGALVTIRDDHLPPLQWKLGRVVQLHPGGDGVTRVATVKTSTGNVKCAVAHLCVLPVSGGGD